MAGAQIASEIRRNLDAEISFAAPDRCGQFFRTVDYLDDAKRFGVHELVDQLPAFKSAVLVQQRRRHVSHVHIERETKRDDLHEWREKHEEQRRPIAKDDDELLVEDGAKTSKKSFHAAFFSFALSARFALRVTKTSSSDGPISRISL